MGLFQKLISHEVADGDVMPQVEQYINTGRVRQGYELLSQAVQKTNHRLDWLELHWSLAKRMNDGDNGFVTAGKLLRYFLSKKEGRRAYMVWHDCLHGFGKRFPVMADLKLAELLMHLRMIEEAGAVVITALEQLNASEPALHVQKLAEIAAVAAPAVLMEKVNLLLRLPQLTPVEQHAIQAAAHKAMRRVRAHHADSTIEVLEDEDEEYPDSRFDVSYVKLETIVAWGLNISTGHGERKLIAYDDIVEIVVAGIKPRSGQPFLLIDLFLDGRNVMHTERRVIRIDSKRLNPMRVVSGAKNPLDAFLSIARDIHSRSRRAVIVPSGELVQQTLPMFSSLDEYENALGG
ncbi:MAG: hypothetical protein KDC35_05175 [Acidobacteria bacterium]|nr:hypothetical protein [Acidobacteriota bacterium]